VRIVDAGGHLISPDGAGLRIQPTGVAVSIAGIPEASAALMTILSRLLLGLGLEWIARIIMLSCETELG
jgi:hypothetical protein